MGNEYSSLTQIHKNAVKCYLAVNYHSQQALLEVLHNNGVPTDPEELYDFFNTIENKNKIDDLKKKRILKDDQINLLLPQNQKTFSKKWDITLICVVIINFSTLPPPLTGWKRDPDPTDTTTAANVLRIRKARNDNNHATLDTLKDENKFHATFNAVEGMLVGLNYTKIIQFRNMNIETLNPALFMKTIQCTKEKENFIKDCLQWYKTENEKSK